MAKATKVKATPKKKPVSPFAAAVKGIKGLSYDQRKRFFEEAGKVHTAEQQIVGNGGQADGVGYDDLQQALGNE